MRGVAVKLLGEAAEVHVLAAQAVDGAHHLDQRAAEPIELPDHEHVVGAQEGQGRLELGALSASLAGLLLLEEALSAGLVRASRRRSRFWSWVETRA